jgi:phospholipid/cholesterol/gamma-HCH transport system substrate-binding protein
MKFKRQTEIIVGVFVIGSLILLLGVVLFMGKRQNILQAHYELSGAFKSVAGLEAGAEVLLAGINVGHVNEIKFGPHNRVMVVMSISEAQRERIRRDSVASIRTRGLVGDHYVEITTGSPDQPLIPDHGTIRTAEPIDVAALLEETRPMLGNLEGLIKNLSALTDQLTDSSGTVKSILENMNAITADIRQGKGTVGALLNEDRLYRHAEKLLQTTQETMENFRDVSTDAHRASKALPALVNETRTSLRKLGEAGEEVSAAMVGFSEFIKVMQGVAEEAKPIASNLRSSSEQIKEMTPRIGPLLESITEGVREGRRVIEAAERSWLIRGYLEPPGPAQPIALGGRARAPEGQGK